MTPEEAREIAKEVQHKEQLKQLDDIDNSTKELLEMSKPFIKSACNNGEFNTMLCSTYDRSNKNEHDKLTLANFRVKNTLEREGYTCDIYDNKGICSINLSISWGT